MRYGLRNYISNPYVIAVIVLRLSGYIYMLFFPFEGILLSMLFDCIDWWILGMGNLPKNFYHVLDKPLDYIGYLFLLPILINSEIFNVYLIFLIWRTLGMIVYGYSNNRKFFILFPNISEYIAFLYLLDLKFNLGVDVLNFKVIIAIIIIKIIQELYLHYIATGNTYKYGIKLGKYIRNET